MVLTGLEAIQTYNTREGDVELEENGQVVAKIKMSRLPLEELLTYYSLFEHMDKDNPGKMFSRDNMKRLMGYMTSSIMCANEGATEEMTREFVATNFFKLFEGFMQINGGGVDVQIPENVQEQLQK